MSTRATYHFPEQNVVIYCHHDGYAEGAAAKLYNMLGAKAKGGLAESFIAGNTEEAEITLCEHGDTEYEYHVTTDDPSGIRLQVYSVASSSRIKAQTYDGPLGTWLALTLAKDDTLAPVVVCRVHDHGTARTMLLPEAETIIARDKAQLGGWIAKGTLSPTSGNALALSERITRMEAEIAEQGISFYTRCHWAA